MTIRIYLDNNATTRPHPEVLAAMRRYEEELYLNASSIAGELLGAAQPLTDARRSMAQLLSASDDDNIVLTSGATEANAWVFSAIPPCGHIVTSAIEHSSVLAALSRARRLGHPTDLVKVDANGMILPDHLTAVLRADTKLVSIQLANNETGVVQPLSSLARLIRDIAPGALIHTDATQALGRIPLDLAADLIDVDLLSFSAHKFHGPKGIGGLYMRQGVELDALIPGEQEHGNRGGTSNVPAAAGLAVAARMARCASSNASAVRALRDELETLMTRAWAGSVVNAQRVERLPNTLSITLPEIDAEDAVERLALRGICLATGSACTAGATAPSHVLTAMGLAQAEARSTLRFSLSTQTKRSDVMETVSALMSLLRTESNEPGSSSSRRHEAASH